MRFLISILFLLHSALTLADTMEHYMNIANKIPQMEIKADPQAQAWARSARNVLTITDESIAETLTQANDIAKAQGNPLFCPPNETELNALLLRGLIMDTFKSISSQESDKERMTVSQVAWLAVTKTYPCQKQASNNQFSIRLR